MSKIVIFKQRTISKILNFSAFGAHENIKRRFEDYVTQKNINLIEINITESSVMTKG